MREGEERGGGGGNEREGEEREREVIRGTLVYDVHV